MIVGRSPLVRYLSGYRGEFMSGVAGRAAGALTGLLHQPFILADVDGHPALFGHEFRQVDGEAVSVVELKGVFAADATVVALGGVGGGLFEEGNAAVEGFDEALLLVADDFGDALRVLPQFGEGFTHGLDDGRHEFAYEGFARSEEHTSELQ